MNTALGTLTFCVLKMRLSSLLNVAESCALVTYCIPQLSAYLMVFACSCSRMPTQQLFLFIQAETNRPCFLLLVDLDTQFYVKFKKIKAFLYVMFSGLLYLQVLHIL